MQTLFEAILKRLELLEERVTGFEELYNKKYSPDFIYDFKKFTEKKDKD